jgi:hypothetical protein
MLSNIKLIIGYIIFTLGIIVTITSLLSVIKANFQPFDTYELVFTVGVVFSTTLIATCIAIKLGLFGQRKRQ